ncbi:uncharacterized protein RHIMIDRAFT_247685 [Rhizopus microsporus ATCC 52813]|uniref:Reverse transcriptase domain-containing protein n=1 Tax=Rhizopus microsporus ATCC 52813 TaxID=1340429 RepID=A0A2G4SIC1_RHIZD|nr:uncharacterized protein RHIMIDRAFT_247685 [Rhizopus microsporus ATCC 52813]PHZ08524.1 hypothetical protein RHIMIDRAFT_247685 [Rhizopus microsporus ATCC 52813]
MAAIHQERGLRQDDPSSSLLCNFALEGLLYHIIQDSSIIGYAPLIPGFQERNEIYNSPETLKVLAYADDVCVLLQSFNDFNRVQTHLSNYDYVSNARLNMIKIEALSLNGRPQPEWAHFLEQHQIIK